MSEVTNVSKVDDYETRFAGQDAPVIVESGPLKGLAVANGYLYVRPYKQVTEAGIVLPNPNQEQETRFVVYGAASGMWDNGVWRPSYLKVGDVVLMDPVRANQRGGLSDFHWGSERYLCGKMDCVSGIVVGKEPDVARVLKPEKMGPGKLNL